MGSRFSDPGCKSAANSFDQGIPGTRAFEASVASASLPDMLFDVTDYAHAHHTYLRPLEHLLRLIASAAGIYSSELSL